MKKKKKPPTKRPDDEVFPVDTLGIPILVEVVQPPTAPASAQSPEISAADCDENSETATADLVPDRDRSTERPTGSDLDQIIEKISKSVSSEILATIEPLIRGRISRALRDYEKDRIDHPRETSGEKPKSD